MTRQLETNQGVSVGGIDCVLRVRIRVFKRGIGADTDTGIGIGTSLLFLYPVIRV